MNYLPLPGPQFIFQQEIFAKPLHVNKSPVLLMASLTLTTCPFSRLTMIVSSCVSTFEYLVHQATMSYTRPGPQWALKYLSILNSLNNVLIKLRSFLLIQSQEIPKLPSTIWNKLAILLGKEREERLHGWKESPHSLRPNKLILLS